jgi:serine protease Do
VCPHCRGSLLVDLTLEQPVRDSKVRFQLARSLGRLGGSFQELQKVLGSTRPVALRGVTRAVAGAGRDVAQSSGFRATIAAATPSLKKSIPNRPVLIAVSVAAAIVLSVVVWMLVPSGDEAPGSPNGAGQLPEELSTQEIAERVTPSIVSLSCRQSVGSGFFISEEQLLTNAHVLCPAGETITVHFSDGRKLPGAVVDQAENLDLALVQVTGAAAVPLPVGDAALISAGQKVVLIGTPLGMEYTVHEGIVSHAARNMFGTAYVQVDANVNPGNSGGPLFDTGGKVIGVISSKVQGAEGLGFALPINYAYSGLNFVDAPAIDLTRWTEIAREVEMEERNAAFEAGQSFVDPALTQVFFDQRQGLLVIILKRSTFPPSPGETIYYSIMRDGMTICSSTATINQWIGFEDAAAAGDAPQLPQFEWLRKHDLTADLYWGLAYFQEPECLHEGHLVSATFVLEQADPNYDRTTILPR